MIGKSSNQNQRNLFKPLLTRNIHAFSITKPN